MLFLLFEAAEFMCLHIVRQKLANLRIILYKECNKSDVTIELNITGRLPPLFFMKPKFARLYLQTRVSGGKVSHNFGFIRDFLARSLRARSRRTCKQSLFSGFNKKFFVGIVVEFFSSLTVYNTAQKELPIG